MLRDSFWWLMKIADFAYLQSPFFSSSASFFSKASFCSCFNFIFLLFRIKFGIKGRLLIVLTIKRSIMFILNSRSGLIWKKEKKSLFKTYCSDHKNLLFSVQNHCSSSPSSNRTPIPTTPITTNIDSGLQQQRQRLSQCRPLQRQRPSTVPSSPPPLATNRVVEPTGGNHHLQQTAVVLAFSSQIRTTNHHLQCSQ